MRLLVILLSLMLVGCNTMSAGPTSLDELLYTYGSLPLVNGQVTKALSGSRWVFRYILEDGKKQEVSDKWVQFLSDRAWTGSDGCDNIAGVYKATNQGEFVVKGLRDMAGKLFNEGCNDAPTRMFTMLLASARSYELAGDELRLSNPTDYSAKRILVFERQDIQ
jgi:hypothetical protein